MKKRTRKPERNASRKNRTSKRKGKPPNCGAIGALDALDAITRRTRSSGATSAVASASTLASSPASLSDPSPVPGTSKRDGLINGTIDGSMAGLSWGEGLVNGGGLIDIVGRGKEAKRSGRPRALARRGSGRLAAPRQHLVAVSSVAIVLMFVTASLLLLLGQQDDDGRIRIDGDFDDWADVTLVDDPVGDVAVSSSTSAEVNLPLDLRRLGVTSDSLYLSFYLETIEPLFGGTSGRTARVLIDSDQDPSSGYAILGLGADYLIELYGRQGYVLTAVLYTL